MKGEIFESFGVPKFEVGSFVSQASTVLYDDEDRPVRYRSEGVILGSLFNPNSEETEMSLKFVGWVYYVLELTPERCHAFGTDEFIREYPFRPGMARMLLVPEPELAAIKPDRELVAIARNYLRIHPTAIGMVA